MNIYKEYGYETRSEYLRELAAEYGLPFALVWSAADMLGENEDFDGLVAVLEDYA